MIKIHGDPHREKLKTASIEKANGGKQNRTTAKISKQRPHTFTPWKNRSEVLGRIEANQQHKQANLPCL